VAGFRGRISEEWALEIGGGIHSISTNGGQK